MGMYGTARVQPFQLRQQAHPAPQAAHGMPLGGMPMMPNPTPQYAPVMNGMGGSQTPAGKQWGSQVANNQGVVAGNQQANAVDQARMNMPQQPQIDLRDPRNAALAGYANA